MRNFLLLIFFAIAIPLLVRAQSHEGGGRAGPKQVIRKFFDGVSVPDTKTISLCTANNFLLLDNGTIWNIDTLVGKLNSAKALGYGRAHHLDFIRASIRGNMAWVIFRDAQAMSINGKKMKRDWLESAVLIKEGNDWKIQLLHSTLVNPNAMANPGPD